MRTIILAIIIAIALYTSYNKMIDIPINYILFVGVVVLVLTYNCDENFEHLTDSQAIQNVASLYNSGTTTLGNLTLTGGLTIKNSSGATTASIDNNGNIMGTGGGTFANMFIGKTSDPNWGGVTHVSLVKNNVIPDYSGYQLDNNGNKWCGFRVNNVNAKSDLYSNISIFGDTTINGNLSADRLYLSKGKMYWYSTAIPGGAYARWDMNGADTWNGNPGRNFLGVTQQFV